MAGNAQDMGLPLPGFNPAVRGRCVAARQQPARLNGTPASSPYRHRHAPSMGLP